LGIPLPFAGEFEVVIMIGVVTEEMHGSDCGKKRGKAGAEQKMKVGPWSSRQDRKSGKVKVLSPSIA
jgi:hypothetical protein